MKIAQITDLHIGLPTEATNNIDVRRNFEAVLQSVVSRRPDLLAITGDLCYRNGEPAVYAWLREILDACGVPYEIIAGNHDASEMMAGAFGRSAGCVDGEYYYAREAGGHRLLFLDSAVGALSARQLAWLSEQLNGMDQAAYVFVHHPPLRLGMPFMDNTYAFREPEKLMPVLAGHPHAVNVFCGHYHGERIVREHNTTVHLTPSTFFQIDPYSETFKVSDYRIAWREITIRPGGFDTAVFYQDGHINPLLA